MLAVRPDRVLGARPAPPPTETLNSTISPILGMYLLSYYPPPLATSGDTFSLLIANIGVTQETLNSTISPILGMYILSYYPPPLATSGDTCSLLIANIGVTQESLNSTISPIPGMSLLD
ncbi:hypothetical protein J6590_034344 [Homalodisca vitripennis]|nr:hypothetical protein J6590_034344 [Homalodisca vitripennis]